MKTCKKCGEEKDPLEGTICYDDNNVAKVYAEWKWRRLPTTEELAKEERTKEILQFIKSCQKTAQQSKYFFTVGDCIKEVERKFLPPSYATF